jgi:hypothetical protein
LNYPASSSPTIPQVEMMALKLLVALVEKRTVENSRQRMETTFADVVC